MSYSENERFCSPASRGLLQKRGDESPLLPEQQGPLPAVVPSSSSSHRTHLATGPVHFRVGKEPDVQEFIAQKEVLATANDVFFALLNGSMQSRSNDIIEICDVEPRAFENLLRFLEGKDVNFRSTTTALFTLMAADKYIEPRLAIKCLHYINNNLSSDVVLELLVYISLLSGDPRGPVNGTTNVPGSPLCGDHSTQTSPLTSPCHDVHHRFDRDESSSPPPYLEDSVSALQNEANGRVVGRRGSNRGRCNASAPSEKDIRKDIEMKEMWRKAKHLRHNCYEWVDLNADEILASETAEDFNANVLSHIVSRPTLGVSSETRVVDLLQRWSKSECRRKGLNITDENRMQCLGDLRFMARYLLMDSDEFLHGQKSTKGSQSKEEKAAIECIAPAFSGLLTNKESSWICNRIASAPQAGRDGIKCPSEPSSLSQWISIMECPREQPVRDFVTLDGIPTSSKDNKVKRKGGSTESSSVRSKLRAALTLGWRRSRGEKRRRDVEVVKEKPRSTEEANGRKRSKDSGTGQRCSGSCFAEYFFTALSCFFD